MCPNELQTHTSTRRFEVSEAGMRELNAGRDPWDLVKELVQNAWDEAPIATYCSVTVEPQSDGNTTLVTAEDDGPGFRDVADAFTLMGPTGKRLTPTKRGRFNTGEKVVISVAIEAEVETVGQTVTFPSVGSRVSTPNVRHRGTVVKVLMPWDTKQSNELIGMLQRFRPPVNCGLFVNDVEVPKRPSKAVRAVSLPTVIQDAPNQPLRTRERHSEIHLVEPYDPGSERWIYEMGIPVQTIDCPWDVDVMQKIPMSPQRNAVQEAYLNRIYAEVLNGCHGSLQGNEFGSQWVKRAIEHPRVGPEAVRATVEGRYGSADAVFATLDQDANRRASDNGYEVVNPGGLSKKEIEAFKKHAGVKASDVVFPTPPQPLDDYAAEPDSDQAGFAEWVVEMAGYCDLSATVRYFAEPGNERLADCSASTAKPILRFNEARLGRAFFQPPYGSAEHWDLLLHELGHALADHSAIGHNELWGNGVSKAGALIAVHLLGNGAD